MVTPEMVFVRAMSIECFPVLKKWVCLFWAFGKPTLHKASSQPRCTTSVTCSYTTKLVHSTFYLWNKGSLWHNYVPVKILGFRYLEVT